MQAYMADYRLVFWNNMLKTTPKFSMTVSVSLDTGTTAAETGSEPDSILNN